MLELSPYNIPNDHGRLPGEHMKLKSPRSRKSILRHIVVYIYEYIYENRMESRGTALTELM